MCDSARKRLRSLHLAVEPPRLRSALDHIYLVLHVLAVCACAAACSSYAE
jgi:hypothetical protein